MATQELQLNAYGQYSSIDDKAFRNVFNEWKEYICPGLYIVYAAFVRSSSSQYSFRSIDV